MIEIIGLDADDTLWENEYLYHRAKNKISQILENYGGPDKIIAQLDKTEVRNIEFYGYGIKSFALSMIESANVLSGGQLTGDEINRIIVKVKEMLAAPVELVAGAEDTLEKLSVKYDLMLITKGDSYEQEHKIERSGIADYFRYLEVVGEKSEGSYRKILGQYNLDPGRFLMVGNSLRSDILPVLRIGGQAVYIPNDQTWFHEQASREEIGEFEFEELERLSQLPDYLAKSNDNPGF